MARPTARAARGAAVLLPALLLAGCGGRAAAPEPAPRALDPVGTYEFQTSVEGQPLTGTIHITGAPGSYTGRIVTGMFPEMPIRSVSVAGQQLLLSAQAPDGQIVEIRLNFTGPTFTGAWTLGDQSGAIAGRRVSG